MTDKPIATTKPRRTVRKGAPPTAAETLGALGSAEPPATATPDRAPTVAAKKAASPKAAATKPVSAKPVSTKAAKLEAKPSSKPVAEAKPKKPASERTKPLNFRVTNEFRKAFKQAAAHEDCKKVELLERMFEAWQASKTAKAN